MYSATNSIAHAPPDVKPCPAANAPAEMKGLLQRCYESSGSSLPYRAWLRKVEAEARVLQSEHRYQATLLILREARDLVRERENDHGDDEQLVELVRGEMLSIVSEVKRLRRENERLKANIESMHQKVVDLEDQIPQAAVEAVKLLVEDAGHV